MFEVDVAFAIDLREFGFALPSGIEAAYTSPVFASNTVESPLRPLKVQHAVGRG